MNFRSFLLVSICVWGLNLSAQSTFYVNHSAAGNNSGTSWPNAFKNLQDAISIATEGDRIWVAQGVYKPTLETDRNQFFSLEEGIKIYAGFVGNESNLSERDFIANETILSGDIGIVGDSLDNSYTVVYSNNTSDETILDGFIIIGGQADDDTQSNTIGRNTCGGGAYLSADSGALECQIVNCIFRNNFAINGGGLCIQKTNNASTTPNLYGTKLRENRAINEGGGLWMSYNYNTNFSTFVIDSLVCENNIAAVGGGAFINYEDENTKLEFLNCEFNNNSSSENGGGLYIIYQVETDMGMAVNNSRFYENSSGGEGGGMYFEIGLNASLLYISNCSVGFNSSLSHGGGLQIKSEVDLNIDISNTSYEWNDSGASGGAVNISSDAEVDININYCNFYFNGAEQAGGGFNSTDLEPIFKFQGCDFYGNHVNIATGGGINVSGENIQIVNSLFRKNISKTGGGIRMTNGSVVNCIFYKNNVLQQGGAIRCSSPTIANCIFNGNSNFGIGPNIFNNSWPLTIQACLFDAESCDEINYNNSNIICDENTVFTFLPPFIDPENNNFRLDPCSEARDGGQDAIFETLQYPVFEDYLGEERIKGTAIDMGIIETPVANFANINVVQADCIEDERNNGIIEINLEGVCLPLHVTHLNNQSSVNSFSFEIDSLQSGTHTISVEDNQGTTIMGQFNVPTIAEMSVDHTSTSPSCPGYSNGSIVLDVNGETGNYSYLWEDNSTNSTHFNVAGGNYAYTVTDYFGCQVNGALYVEAPSPIEINSTIVPTSCIEPHNGSISLNPTGGTGTDYTAQWNNNMTGLFLDDLEQGGYFVTVMDENGCSKSDFVIVHEPEEINIVFENIAVPCHGKTNGSISAVANGAYGDIDYQWNNDLESQTISNLGQGSYTVSVQDALGCTAQANYTLNEANEVIIISNTQDISCFGLNDGIINIDTTNLGNNPNFNWSDNVPNPGQALQNNLDSGIYQVSVTTSLGCNGSEEFIISQPDEITIENEVILHPCIGTNNGSISIIGTQGGVLAAGSNYQYAWSENTNGQSNANPQNLAPGAYQLTISDDNDCQVEKNLELISNQVLIVSEVIQNLNCFEDNSGSITLSVTGGTPDNSGNYQYHWSNEASTHSIDQLSSDSYDVTIIDSEGCENMVDYQIEQPDEIIIEIMTNDLTCFESNDGNISILVQGGIEPYTTLSSQNPPYPAGKYEITVLDNNNCLQTSQFQINQPDEYQHIADIQNATTSTSNDGSITIDQIQGGTAPYDFLWSNNTTNQNLQNAPADTYTLTLTDANGCTYQFEYTIEFETQNINIIDKEDLKLSIFPNPTSDAQNTFLYLYSQSQKVYQINIFNSLGQTIQTFPIQVNAQQNINVPIQTQSLASGSYTIQVLDLKTNRPKYVNLLVNR